MNAAESIRTSVKARKRVARLTRRLAAGRLTVQAYENLCRRAFDRFGDDDAAHEIVCEVVEAVDDALDAELGWHRPLCKPIGPSKTAFSAGLRRDLARVVLFLRAHTTPQLPIPTRMQTRDFVGGALFAGAVGASILGWWTGNPFLVVGGVSTLLLLLLWGVVVWCIRGVRQLEPAEIVWPFADAEEFERARSSPTFLDG